MRQPVRNTKIVVVHHSEDKKYKSRVKKIKIVGNIIYLFFQKLFFTLNILFTLLENKSCDDRTDFERLFSLPIFKNLFFL